MESVKGNSDRQQDVEMRRLIHDPDARKQPLEVLKQKIPVLEKPEHAQVHADACDEPAFLGMLILRFTDLATEPEIHCRSREKEGSQWRIPRAVENVARDYEQIFSELPAANAPVKGDDDYEENDESERIKKHGESSVELCWQPQSLINANHIEADVLDTLLRLGKNLES